MESVYYEVLPWVELMNACVEAKYVVVIGCRSLVALPSFLSVLFFFVALTLSHFGVYLRHHAQQREHCKMAMSDQRNTITKFS